jgi:hypothetical protein
MAMEYANKLINETISTRFLGMQINNHLNWKKTYRSNSSQTEYCTFFNLEVVLHTKYRCSENGALCILPFHN